MMNRPNMNLLVITIPYNGATNKEKFLRTFQNIKEIEIDGMHYDVGCAWKAISPSGGVELECKRNYTEHTRPLKEG